MSEHNAEYSLDTIMVGVHSAELLGEILDLYAGSSERGRKFSSQVILPCLDARIAVVIKGCHESVARAQMDRIAMRRVVQAAADLARTVAELRALQTAEDYGGPMEAVVGELGDSTLEVYKAVLPILRMIVEEETAALTMNTSYFEEAHGQAKVLASDGAFEEQLAAKAVRDVAIRLTEFRDTMKTGQVRSAIAQLLRSVVAGGAKADHLGDLLRRRAAKNELVPANVLASSGAVSDRYSQLVALIVEVGNTIYVSEETRRSLIGSIEAYLCVYRRWEVDGKRVADCVPQGENGDA